MNSLWSKAREASADAHFLYEAQRYDAACNRAYYAMFNAARALLVHQGIDPKRAKRHATVLQLFSLHFVKDGPFEVSDGHALGNAGRARNKADYSDKQIERDVVDDVITALDRFMQRAERLLSAEISKQGKAP
jgi:uncharacterized protein (UPF0332 family)